MVKSKMVWSLTGACVLLVLTMCVSANNQTRRTFRRSKRGGFKLNGTITGNKLWQIREHRMRVLNTKLNFLFRTNETEYDDQGHIESVDDYDDRALVRANKYEYYDLVLNTSTTTEKSTLVHGLYLTKGNFRRTIQWGCFGHNEEVMFERKVFEPPTSPKNASIRRNRRIRVIKRGYNITRVECINKALNRTNSGSCKILRGGVGQHGVVILLRLSPDRNTSYLIKVVGHQLPFAPFVPFVYSNV